MTAKSGSFEATGGGVRSGSDTSPSSTNTSDAAWRASSVTPATNSCGPTTIASDTTTAARVAAVGRIGVSDPGRADGDEAPREDDALGDEQTRSGPTGSNRRAASAVGLLVSAAPASTTSGTSIGTPRMIAHLTRPADRCPRPGKTALSISRRGADGLGEPVVGAGTPGGSGDRAGAGMASGSVGGWGSDIGL